MTLAIAACAGFLLGVLWMDLMFDTQILTRRDEAVESISRYYHRATTTSRPMSRLIAAVMAILLGALGFRFGLGNYSVWVVVASSVLVAVPIGLAMLRTVPNAVRLGERSCDAAEETRLARAILGDHLVCFVLMVAFLVLLLSTS